MDVIRPEIHVEGFSSAFGLLNELKRALRKSPGALRPIHPRNLAPAQFVTTQRILLGRLAVERIANRQQAVAQSFELSQRLVKAIFRDERCVPEVPLAAHVPLSKMAR